MDISLENNSKLSECKNQYNYIKIRIIPNKDNLLVYSSKDNNPNETKSKLSFKNFDRLKYVYIKNKYVKLISGNLKIDFSNPKDKFVLKNFSFEENYFSLILDDYQELLFIFKYFPPKSDFWVNFHKYCILNSERIKNPHTTYLTLAELYLYNNNLVPVSLLLDEKIWIRNNSYDKVVMSNWDSLILPSVSLEKISQKLSEIISQIFHGAFLKSYQKIFFILSSYLCEDRIYEKNIGNMKHYSRCMLNLILNNFLLPDLPLIVFCEIYSKKLDEQLMYITLCHFYYLQKLNKMKITITKINNELLKKYPKLFMLYFYFIYLTQMPFEEYDILNDIDLNAFQNVGITFFLWPVLVLYIPNQENNVSISFKVEFLIKMLKITNKETITQFPFFIEILNVSNIIDTKFSKELLKEYFKQIKEIVNLEEIETALETYKLNYIKFNSKLKINQLYYFLIFNHIDSINKNISIEKIKDMKENNKTKSIFQQNVKNVFEKIKIFRKVLLNIQNEILEK